MTHIIRSSVHSSHTTHQIRKVYLLILTYKPNHQSQFSRLHKSTLLIKILMDSIMILNSLQKCLLNNRRWKDNNKNRNWNLNKIANYFHNKVIEISIVLREIIRKSVSSVPSFEKRRLLLINQWLDWNRSSCNKFNRPKTQNLKPTLILKIQLKNNMLK